MTVEKKLVVKEETAIGVNSMCHSEHWAVLNFHCIKWSDVDG